MPAHSGSNAPHGLDALDARAPSKAAFAVRSLALFGILFQLNRIAGDMSDTPVFIATLLVALAAACALRFKGVAAFPAALALLLAPFAARLVIALPRVAALSIASAAALDGLLLDYDRNNFVLCLPFYYTALGSFFALTSRRVLRSLALVDCTLLAALFCVARSGSIGLYRLPVTLLAVFGTLLALELAVLVLCVPAGFYVGKKEKSLSFAFLAAALLAGGILLFFQVENAGSEGQAGAAGGAAGSGLLKPELFSFDMTASLNLHTEVSLGNDLIYIVRKEGDRDGRQIFMRRFVLSAYNSLKNGSVEAGFTRDPRIDEKNQRDTVPLSPLQLNPPPYQKRERLLQEYYIKNIDGAAFLAMNEPAAVTPFRNYDASSFKSVYSVESLVSYAAEGDLSRAAAAHRSDAAAGLTAEEFAWYTAFANASGGATKTEERMRSLAQRVTEPFADTYSRAAALCSFFRNGEYRYSLKPGIAPDKDQLAYFLFESKRGYCTYFALAYASMLRSLAIPSRVAVGFFLDPATEYFGFYPVRSSNAHAWVEVFIPEYGWIAFDPTTDNYADDELMPSASGAEEDNFDLLMKEILENRGKLNAQQAPEEKPESAFLRIARKAAEKARAALPAALALLLLAGFLLARFRFYLASLLCRSARAKTLLLWRHTLLRLAIKGYRRGKTQTESEWLETLPCAVAAEPLFRAAQEARFAPEAAAAAPGELSRWYRDFCGAYAKLARKKRGAPLALFLFALLFARSGAAAEEFDSADALYDAAENAVYAQYWERAIILLNQGKAAYPADWRFTETLGDLYFSRQLYTLAKTEYRDTLARNPGYARVLYRLARTTGSLNEYEAAAAYYEQYIELNPESSAVISELGWVYFKLHRLQESETLLLEAIEAYGVEPELAMTLATTYADMFNYGQSSRWYSAAMSAAASAAGAEPLYDPFGFISTACYNFAILESRFYQYDNSLELAERALQYADRDTGHMMRGELYGRRLDYTKSFAEFSKAFALDKQSPLPKASLAQTFLFTGRFEEARAYAEDCFKAANQPWMFRFGIDPAQYERDLHEILYKTYAALDNKERFTVYGGWKDAAAGALRRLEYRFKHFVHQTLFRKKALITARSYHLDEPGGQYLDALTQYYAAFDAYPRRAAFYLRRAAEYEITLIPEAEPSYLYERGRLEKNSALLELALGGFDPVWERDKSVDALSRLAELGSAAARRAAAEKLYLLNPAALAQEGIRLPVALQVEGGTASERHRLTAAIKKTLFQPLPEKNAAASRFELRVTLSERGAVSILRDRAAGTVLARAAVPLAGFSAAALAPYAAALCAAAFTTRL